MTATRGPCKISIALEWVRTSHIRCQLGVGACRSRKEAPGGDSSAKASASAASSSQQLPAEVPKMKVRHDSEAIKEGEASSKIGRFRADNV